MPVVYRRSIFSSSNGTDCSSESDENSRADVVDRDAHAAVPAHRQHRADQVDIAGHARFGEFDRQVVDREPLRCGAAHDFVDPIDSVELPRGNVDVDAGLGVDRPVVLQPLEVADRDHQHSCTQLVM